MSPSRAWCLFAFLIVGRADGGPAERPVERPEFASLQGLPSLPTQTVDGVSCTLHDAILAANSGGTVGGCTGAPGIEVLSLESDLTVFTQDATHSTLVGGAFAGLPDVSTAIVLVAGAGSVVERSATLGCEAENPDDFRLFNVTASGALYLVGLTIRNGCVAPIAGEASEGGALHVEGGLLELHEVTLEGNFAHATDAGDPGASGGAVFCRSGSVVHVFATDFLDNEARGTDGASALGGALAGVDCELGVLADSTFADNRAFGSSDPAGAGRGGALSLTDSTLASLERSSFVGQTARGGDDPAGDAAGAEGGALYLEDSIVDRIDSVHLQGNEALGGQAVLSRMDAQRAGARGGDAVGGAVALSGPSVIGEIVSSVFAGNLAGGGDGGSGSDGGSAFGGALSIGDGATVEWLHDSWVDANRALSGSVASGSGSTIAHGGGLSLEGSLELMERTTFSGNVAECGQATGRFAFGGAISHRGEAGRFALSTFHANRAGSAGPPPAPGILAVGRGGAIMFQPRVGVLLAANTFVDNQTRGDNPQFRGRGGNDPDNGGALYADASATSSFPVAIGNLFAGNRSVSADGSVIRANDCVDEQSQCALDSGGWNVITAPASCEFDAGKGDLIGVTAAVHELADWGCETTLFDGSCPPTVAIDQASLATDAGNCAATLVDFDARGVPRPFDFEALADAFDGCDAGAFEAFDLDGDLYSEAVDCDPEDPLVHALDVCGVCGGDGACLLFTDGFESGDVAAWL